MPGLAALDAPLQAVPLADPLGKVGLHLGQRLGPAQEVAAVEFALGIQGHHIGVQVRGSLVPVDAGIDQVFGPVPFLKPGQRIGKVGVLVAPALAVHAVRAAGDQVLYCQHPVLSDLLRQSLLECRHRLLDRVRAQVAVLLEAGWIGVGGILGTEGMLEGAAHGDSGFELLRAEDSEGHKELRR
nr:hypothetical protein [Aeromonas hydrophila]